MSKPINISESDIVKMVSECVKKTLSENSNPLSQDYNWEDDPREDDENAVYDPYEEAIYRDSIKERLPKGWDKYETKDGETIYSDPDGFEYVKDEYGDFVRIENPEFDEELGTDEEYFEEMRLRASIGRMVNEAFEVFGDNTRQPQNIEGNGFMDEKKKRDSQSDIRKHIRQIKKDARRAERHQGIHKHGTIGDRVSKTKRAEVLSWLKNNHNNCAQIMRDLWHPTKKKEDSARSYFYKCRDGELNDSGVPYRFSDEEINALYRIKSNMSAT